MLLQVMHIFKKKAPNRMKYYYLIPATLLCLTACGPSTVPGDREQWKEEIVQAEQDFAQMAQKDGIEKAFTTYAADSAVVMRNNDVIIGKEKIAAHYKNQTSKGLSWEPDFVEVSKSGDLGYTYGRYRFLSVDSLGQTHAQTGIFHTVWKRQEVGTWRFVWD